MGRTRNRFDRSTKHLGADRLGTLPGRTRQALQKIDSLCEQCRAPDFSSLDSEKKRRLARDIIQLNRGLSRGLSAIPSDVLSLINPYIPAKLADAKSRGKHINRKGAK